MSDKWTQLLSEYIDGDLDSSLRERLEDHLIECAECRSVTDDIRRVVKRAEALDDRPPSADLWQGIQARIATKRQSDSDVAETTIPIASARRYSFSIPQLAAAAVLLIVVSSFSVATFLDRPAEVTVFETVSVSDQVLPAGLREEYELAISDLQNALRDGRQVLDSATVNSIEYNLEMIDRAISDANEALRADPNSAYLSGHLAEIVRRKVDFLRRANRLVAEAGV